MKLAAVILRLEGVVFATGETFRLSTNEVLADAGFSHRIDTDAFTLNFGQYICKERFFEYAARHLYPRRRSDDDLRSLIEVTYRRIIVTAERKLLAASPPARSDLLDLAEAARGAGLKLGVVASIRAETAEALIEAALGAGIPVFAASRMRNVWTGTAFERSIDALSAALEQLAVQPGECFALQSSSYGLAAADVLGVPAAAIIAGTVLNGGLYGARAVVDELIDIAGEPERGADEDRGGLLLRALKKLYAAERKLTRNDGSHAMQVHDILKDKGAAVKSVNPTDTVQFVSKRLTDEKVGAMVVLSTTGELEGIVSERDIIRGLSVHRCDLLPMPVSSIMTRAVITCSPADSLYGVGKVMTSRRIRHLPVSEGGKLVGLISIGDVLSRRIEEVQLEANVLRDYTIALR